MLLKEAKIEYIPHFLDEKAASDFCDFCLNSLPFEFYPITLYGKTFIQPRRQCMLLASDIKTYSYSSVTLPGTPFPAEVDSVIDKIMAVLPENHPRINAALCNLYEDGKHYISQHSDKETDLVSDACIVSLSLGSTRRFDIKAN
jgi:alkylated DNA repair dioxygenase AlkB